MMQSTQMTREQIVEKDIEALYLGNLRTVEFDLNLPAEGKYGSLIRWATKDDRFITTDGKVTRPSYGKGDRVIQLTATFEYDGYSDSKVYDAKVLEEENDIVVEEVFPVHLVREVGQAFYLPQVVAIKTDKGEVIAHSVTWPEGEKVSYDATGTYTLTGFVKDTEYDFTAEIEVQKDVETTHVREKLLSPFSIHEVRLTGDSMVKQAQDRRLQFLLSVDDDQMLYNFREAAGLDTQGAPEMIGWDSPDSLLKGHTTGHYLSALALCYGCTGNDKILAKLTYMIAELNKVQLAFEADEKYHYGFISGYSEEQFDLLEEYVPYPQIWAPYYTLHKIFAGLLDAYEIAGNETALVMADKLGDWTYDRLSRLPHEQLKKMWGMYIAGEFGGMNESLAALYLHTKKPEHLAAAQLFDNDRLFFPMEQQVDALGALHANQHIPQILGSLRIYDASMVDKYYQIADFFWESIINSHIYSIGGTGDTEMFQQPYAIGRKIGEHTAETCASYNMLKLTKELYEYEPTPAKMDYYERTMLNHILSSTDHEGIGGSTYFMPTDPGAQKGFDIENSCCHGTGLENHFKYVESIFYQSPEVVEVDLFVSATLKNDLVDLEMTVDENGPENVVIKVNALDRQLAIRDPYWSKGQVVITIDGETVTPKLDNGHYLISPASGSTVKVHFQANPRLEATPDVAEIVSLGYGPYILAAVNEGTDYLTIQDLSGVTKASDSLTFSCHDLTFKPLAQINHEHYHVYLKH